MISSPFKFLDSYKEEDKDLFFGRKKEVEELYEKINTTKLLMVYGASGTGKTSLIECGLRNSFSELDWEAVNIRRNQHIMASFFEQFNLHLSEKKRIKLIPNEAGLLFPERAIDMGTAIKMLYQDTFKPVYLLLDQFEELLILGGTAEKETFFKQLQSLLETSIPCCILLILREEFIGHLSEYEEIVPALFQNRYRVEKMNKGKVEEVILETLNAADKFNPPFEVEDPEELTAAILKNLPDDAREIELVHLQVYFDKLWKDDYEVASKTKRPVQLQASLVSAEDKLQTILAKFLTDQISERKENDARKLPTEMLATMVTREGTKLQKNVTEIKAALQANDVPFQENEIDDLLIHFSHNRILRILKSGEMIRYELSHDILALIVKGMFTQEMQWREKAADIYNVYQEKKGNFSQEDLDYIRPYQQYKAYPQDLQERIWKSEEYIRKSQAEKLEEAKQNAEKERLLREEAQQAQQKSEEERQKAEAQRLLAEKSRKEAEQAQQKAEEQRLLAEEEKQKAEAQRAFAEKSQKEAEEQRLKAEKSKKTAQRNLFYAGAIAVIAIVVSFIAWDFKNKADTETKRAKTSEEVAKTEKQNAISEKVAADSAKKRAERSEQKAQLQKDSALMATKKADSLAIIASKEENRAKVEKQHAEENLKKMKIAEEARIKQEVEKYLQGVARMRQINDTLVANQMLEEARKRAKDYPSILNNIH